MTEIYKATEKHAVSDSEAGEIGFQPLGGSRSIYAGPEEWAPLPRNCGRGHNSRSPSPWPGFETTSPGRCLTFLEAIKSAGRTFIKNLESCIPGS